MNSLLDEDLAHKQIPGHSIEISALDIGSMQPGPASSSLRAAGGVESMRDYPSSGLSVTTYLPGEGVPQLPPSLSLPPHSHPHPHHGAGGTLGRTVGHSQALHHGSSTLGPPTHHPLSSTSISGTMQCKHRAPNGGLFLRQSPGKNPMSYQGVSGGPIPEAIDPAHSTSI
ncbi:hypothetical protein NHX12_025440 [Muraenolepis orangiensis]|uniref:Uncharacterized protein n=1 Tax=Muraenolepis orangiensis TaxID=630683 RepID=A0A9Q0EL59_9TELE|nr:hypothetical protein NHX12_025440 [Muraenolepis orangiensis]